MLLIFYNLCLGALEILHLYSSMVSARVLVMWLLYMMDAADGKGVEHGVF